MAKTTKPWNVDLSTLKEDSEAVFVDYKDFSLREPTVLKFKTTDTKSWKTRHQNFYKSGHYKENGYELTIDTRREATTLRLRKSGKTHLCVKFLPDGTVQGQGECMLTWGLLHVPQMRNVESENSIPGNAVTFNGDGSELSNFYTDAMVYKKQVYPAVENCYQAHKLSFMGITGDETEQVETDPNPYNVKQVSKTAGKHPDWEVMKIDKMYSTVEARLDQSASFRAKLLSTEGSPLVHTVDDTEWGFADGRGANAMGRLLEVLRRVARIRYGETGGGDGHTTQSWEDEVNSLSQPTLTQENPTERCSGFEEPAMATQTDDAGDPVLDPDTTLSHSPPPQTSKGPPYTVSCTPRRSENTKIL